MGESDFNELAGRIEAVGRLAMNLVAELEDAGLMDGEAFAKRLRRGVPHPKAAATEPQQAVLASTVQALQQMADSIDDARNWRQSRVHPAETRSDQRDGQS